VLSWGVEFIRAIIERVALIVLIGCASACRRRAPGHSPDGCGPLTANPIVIASSQHLLSAITTDGANVYWIEIVDRASLLIRWSKTAGGPPLAIARGRQSSGNVSVADDQYVYWTALSGAVERASKTGGPADVIAASKTSEGQTWQKLTLDQAYVYWINVGEPPLQLGQVMRVPKSGGPTAVIASDQVGLLDVVANDSHVYWAAQRGVWRWSKSTAIVEHFVDAPLLGASNYALALDDLYLYWVDGRGVYRSPLIGGKAETILASPAESVLLNGSCLYVATPSGLTRVSKSGGAASPLFAWRDDTPVSFSLDDSGVYWTSAANASAQVFELLK